MPSIPARLTRPDSVKLWYMKGQNSKSTELSGNGFELFPGLAHQPPNPSLLRITMSWSREFAIMWIHGIRYTKRIIFRWNRGSLFTMRSLGPCYSTRTVRREPEGWRERGKCRKRTGGRYCGATRKILWRNREFDATAYDRVTCYTTRKIEGEPKTFGGMEKIY